MQTLRYLKSLLPPSFPRPSMEQSHSAKSVKHVRPRVNENNCIQRRYSIKTMRPPRWTCTWGTLSEECLGVTTYRSAIACYPKAQKWWCILEKFVLGQKISAKKGTVSLANPAQSGHDWSVAIVSQCSVTGALLYQLSYEVTHWDRGQFIEFISPVRSEMIWIIYEIIHFWTSKLSW